MLDHEFNTVQLVCAPQKPVEWSQIERPNVRIVSVFQEKPDQIDILVSGKPQRGMSIYYSLCRLRFTTRNQNLAKFIGCCDLQGASNCTVETSTGSYRMCNFCPVLEANGPTIAEEFHYKRPMFSPILTGSSLLTGPEFLGSL